MYFMTFVEEDVPENQTPCKLSLWRTTENKLWVEIGGDDSYPQQECITLGLCDAIKLRETLDGIISDMEAEQAETKTPSRPLREVTPNLEEAKRQQENLAAVPDLFSRDARLKNNGTGQ